VKKQGSAIVRKLVLNRETLTQLDQVDMSRVAGGYSDVSLCYATQTSNCGHTRPACEI
jgi:hypothetical protein